MHPIDWDSRKTTLLEEIGSRPDLEDILMEVGEQGDRTDARIRTTVRRALRRQAFQQSIRDRAEKLNLPNYGRF
jgi:hypothetical protein